MKKIILTTKNEIKMFRTTNFLNLMTFRKTIKINNFLIRNEINEMKEKMRREIEILRLSN